MIFINGGIKFTMINFLLNLLDKRYAMYYIVTKEAVHIDGT